MGCMGRSWNEMRHLMTSGYGTQQKRRADSRISMFTTFTFGRPIVSWDSLASAKIRINLHVTSFLKDPQQFICDFIPQQWPFIPSVLMSHVRSASSLLRRAWSELLMPRAHAPLPTPIHCRSSALRSMERRRLSSRRIHLCPPMRQRERIATIS